MLIGFAIWRLLPNSENAQAHRQVVPRNVRVEVASRWKLFRSNRFQFEIRYPPDWGMALQGDDLIDFGPGTPKPAAGIILLDLKCLYNAETKIYGERTEATARKVAYGPNHFIEKKIYVVSHDTRRLAFHNFTMMLPHSYRGNHCRTVSFIVRQECEQEILANMLGSFRVVQNGLDKRPKQQSKDP